MTDYYGQHLNHTDCEMLAVARINPNFRKRESALLRTKWFDYRLLHPVKATYLYAAQYRSAVQLMYGRTKDIRGAGEVKAFTPEDVFQCGELVSFWRARQELDALGVRYEFGLRFAMNKYINNGWRFFPRPNQMLGEELLLDIRDAWAEECAIRLQIAEAPDFRAGQFVGSPAQIAYREWLLECVRRRANKIGALATLLKEGIIDTLLAEERFGASVANQANKFAATLG